MEVPGESREGEGDPVSPPFQTEVSEDDNHSPGNVHALLPPFPPHPESLLLFQIFAASQSAAGRRGTDRFEIQHRLDSAWWIKCDLLFMLDHLQHAGGHQCGLQGDSTTSQCQQLSGPHPVLPGWAGHPQQPQQEVQDNYSQSRTYKHVLDHTAVIHQVNNLSSCWIFGH